MCQGFPQRLSILLSDGKTPLWSSFTLAMLENSWYVVMVP